MALIKLNTRSIPDAEIGTVNIADDAVTPVKIASELQPFNRIINGAMTIDQRNAGAAVTITTGNEFSADRFHCVTSVSSKFSAQQTTTVPAGFINSLKVTSLSAYTVGSSEQNIIRQNIEGVNFGDLAWGTASASTVTLSFKVYSSLTGTFGGSIFNHNGSRSYPFTYTIGTANTWTDISVTIAGDQSGVWLSNNAVGATLSFGLGVGSALSATAGSWAGAYYPSATGAVSILGTSGATFYITGVQLEAGSTASPFAHENVGDTLQKCYRYAYKYGGTSSDNYACGQGLYADGNEINFGPISLPVPMRSTLSLTSYGTPIVKNNGTPATGFTVSLSNPDLQTPFVRMSKSGHGVASSPMVNLNFPTTSDYFIFHAGARSFRSLLGVFTLLAVFKDTYQRPRHPGSRLAPGNTACH